mmetsp:Transcript_33262/g.50270  ORF Transcript_33262/g.50270 Transcript_33262/m.50270 type:complete len:128 (+) Transcript_33262:135-518(+)
MSKENDRQPAATVTRAQRLAEARRGKLETLTVQFLVQFKKACDEAHKLGRYELTWGAILPAIMPGSDEDLDEVLELFGTSVKDLGFKKIEYCKAQAPTSWDTAPARFGSHVHVRVAWSEDQGDLFVC